MSEMKIISFPRFKDEQLADMVEDGYFGDEENRKMFLADRYKDVQKIVDARQQSGDKQTAG